MVSLTFCLAIGTEMALSVLFSHPVLIWMTWNPAVIGLKE